ncbi:hypothetical protein WN51_12156 [Melipona quadrifasciata]|uniref:Uncharacterized protein n=1 Tax=Melipona quadrifasciata TaxID=166423 RepID=A0A0M9A3G7_9HYME|nr:hypothetical protein WN51_12156 [Melipona quadrifasciata]
MQRGKKVKASGRSPFFKNPTLYIWMIDQSLGTHSAMYTSNTNRVISDHCSWDVFKFTCLAAAGNRCDRKMIPKNESRLENDEKTLKYSVNSRKKKQLRDIEKVNWEVGKCENKGKLMEDIVIFYSLYYVIILCVDEEMNQFWNGKDRYAILV